MMLGVDYIDLLMVHWPERIKPECMLGRGDELCSDAVETYNFPSRDMVDPGFQARRDTWKALQLALRLHKVRSIGVSNFNQAQLQDLMHNVSAKPAVLQMFWNPLLHDEAMRTFCAAHGIQLQAFDAMRMGILSHPSVQHVASRTNLSTPQVILRYLIQKNVSVVVGTADPAHMQQNLAVDFVLDSVYMQFLSESFARKELREQSANIQERANAHMISYLPVTRWVACFLPGYLTLRVTHTRRETRIM